MPRGTSPTRRRKRSRLCSAKRASAGHGNSLSATLVGKAKRPPPGGERLVRETAVMPTIRETVSTIKSHSVIATCDICHSHLSPLSVTLI